MKSVSSSAPYAPGPDLPPTSGNGSRTGTGRLEGILYGLLCAIVLLYVVLRAASVTWVHDEATSIYWFMERGLFLPYHALWDAGNHYLSSALGVLSYKIWGLSLLGSRTGSLLAFPLYAWALYRIGEHLAHTPVRWLSWVVLLTCPFLLDFFSLFRGYALGMAFWLLALDGMIRYSKDRRDMHLFQLLLAMALADLAVLSLVPLWALVVAATGCMLAHQWRMKILRPRSVIIWICSGALPLLLGLLLAWEFRRRGLLYHGSTEGFIPVTLASLSQYVIGSRQMFVLISVPLLVVLATAMAIRGGVQRVPFLLMALLWADVIMRIAMAVILGVNYPEDRAGLHLVPLTILLIVFAADGSLPGRPYPAMLMLLPLIHLPVRAVSIVNLDHTLLWPEQSVPERFIEKIHAFRERMGRPLLIGAYHQMAFSLPYTAKVLDLPVDPPDVMDFPNARYDIAIADHRYIDKLLKDHVVIDHAPGNSLHLLSSTTPLDPTAVEQWQLPPMATAEEYVPLWGSPGPVEREWLVEVDLHITSDHDPLNIDLVVSQFNGEENIYYHGRPLALMRTDWHQDRLHVLLRIPVAPNATESKVYLWDQERSPFIMEQGRITLWTIDQAEEHPPE